MSWCTALHQAILILIVIKTHIIMSIAYCNIPLGCPIFIFLNNNKLSVDLSPYHTLTSHSSLLNHCMIIILLCCLRPLLLTTVAVSSKMSECLSDCIPIISQELYSREGMWSGQLLLGVNSLVWHSNRYHVCPNELIEFNCSSQYSHASWRAI